MKVNRMFTVFRLTVLAVVVAGFNVKAADVPAFEGKFTLSSSLHWGLATLAAGEYSFSLDHAYPGSVVTVRRGTQVVARVLAKGVSDTNSRNSEIISENGIVREVNLPTLGISLQYTMPTSNRHAAPRQVPMAQTITIVAKGNGQ